MVVPRAQIVERTLEGVLVGQGPSEIGGVYDHFVPGGVCKEVTVGLPLLAVQECSEATLR